MARSERRARRKAAGAGLDERHELRPLSELRRRPAALLRALSRTRRPVIVTERGAARAVLLDVASYAQLREMELLLKVVALGRRAAPAAAGPGPGGRRRA